MWRGAPSGVEQPAVQHAGRERHAVVQFSFQAEGEERINPLDGTPFGVNEVDDCWAVRTGTEYLWVLPKTEIPLRAGLSWEQRPAIGNPDQYWVSASAAGSPWPGPGQTDP